MKTLIVKMSSLGDLFHALPAVHNLKAKTGTTIDWVANSQYVDLAKCFEDVDRVIPFPRHSILSGLGAFVRDLRAEEYDCIIDMQGLLKSALVARLARGRQRIGPSFCREGARLFYTAVAGKRDKNRHAVDENLDVVRYLGYDVMPPVFPVRFPAKHLEEKKPRVALLPGSRWPSKNWPVGNFITVAKRLKDEVKDVSFFIIGDGTSVAEAAGMEAALSGAVVNLAGKTSLVETGSLLKEMDLLLANDSGPVHMAAAVGTPALVVFGPTDPMRTGPYGTGHRIARTWLRCQPCFSRKCRQGEIPCLRGVSPGWVGDMALEMLGSRLA